MDVKELFEKIDEFMGKNVTLSGICTKLDAGTAHLVAYPPS